MSVNLSPVGGVAGQFFDNNGDPLVGGKLFTYAAGTTTPQVTYTSSSGGTPNSNPIILNAGGRVPSEIWLTDGLGYKFVLYSSTDQLIGSWDNIIGINSNFVNFVTSEEVQIATAGQTVFTLTTMSYQPGLNNLVVYVDGVNQVEGGSYSFVETNSTTVTFTAGLHLGAVVKFVSAETLTTVGSNANVIAYEPAGAGAVTTTVQAKLRETVSVKDFGAVGDGVTDDTAAMQAAHNTGQIVYYPPGTYKFTTLTNIVAGGIVGAGQTQSVLLSTNTTNADLITFVGDSVGGPNNALTFQDFMLQGQVAQPTPKTAGAGIKIAPTPNENTYAYASNVTISYVPIGFDFVRASFFTLLGCKLLAYTISGVQVANGWNNDAGDSSIIGCAFSCPFNGGALPAGIRQFSSGGLRVVGNKFLGGNFGYLMQYTDSDGAGTNTSNLLISANSIENFHTNAIAFEKISVSLTAFSNIAITGNQISVALATPIAFLIASDSNSWLRNVSISGNVIQLPGVTNSYGVSLVGVTCLNISGNTFRGNGGTSQAIALTSCSDVKIGTNVYSNISLPYGFVTPVSNNSVVLDSQSGAVTTASSGWSAYFGTDLYISPTVTVTFPTPFLIAPQASNVQLSLSSGDGSLSGVVVAVSTTQLQVAVVASKTNFAAEVYWKVSGVL
jgi:hypothetical protein